MEKKELIKTVFKVIFENKTTDEVTISQYFSTDYVQTVNNETLDFDAFVEHIAYLQTKASSCTITFNTLIGEGDIVFSNHMVDTTLKNGDHVRHHVLAEFTLKENKIVRCDELTCLLDGHSTYRNLGSAQKTSSTIG